MELEGIVDELLMGAILNALDFGVGRGKGHLLIYLYVT